MLHRKGKLKFTDRRFRALIEKSFDVIALIDSKAKILYASPSIVRLFGRRPTEFTSISGLRFIHPIDLPKIVKLLGSLLLHPEKSIQTELRIKHKNGEWRWVNAIATNLLNDKEIQGIVVNFNDITEHKLLEERKDEFINIASHELKTPITSLKLYIQLMKRQKKVTPHQYLDQMESQLDKLNYLINELLNVSKIQGGKLDLKKKKFNITNLMEEIVKDLQQSSSHQIIIQGETKKIVFADKSHISQVFTNLITNAIKYSPKNSKIIVKCVKRKDWVQVSVQDFGIGIEKKNIGRIFEKFFQERNRIKRPSGLGLGLYISAIIIKQHNGKIWVKSEKNKGSIFTFSLPER